MNSCSTPQHGQHSLGLLHATEQRGSLRRRACLRATGLDSPIETRRSLPDPGVALQALARLSDPGSPAGPLAAGKALITGTIAVGGAGYKVARITDGAADLWIFPRSGTSRWDTCAGEAMLQALGGLLRDKAGRPICYDPDGSFENLEGIIAGADPELVDCAVRACAKL
ncbi:unnamed protein product [Polarella glacialis]|uniref:3'(2'),5'-bisphosphate nucleotidase 1 n=1 Tax=Polarella glacialis TaxID=89957 RepID=A0A813LZH6_POLGL|nr:unnamed protein product [Polarella glacialis]